MLVLLFSRHHHFFFFFFPLVYQLTCCAFDEFIPIIYIHVYKNGFSHVYCCVSPTQVAVIKLEAIECFCEPTKYYHYYQLACIFYDLTARII